jgi:hypothetical protein
MDTLQRLKLKANASFSDKCKMPSIRQISKLLSEYDIKHEVSERANVVEYRSKGNRYVNNRHNGKIGLCLEIKAPYLELDTSDSYYSANTRDYARQLVTIVEEQIAKQKEK